MFDSEQLDRDLEMDKEYGATNVGSNRDFAFPRVWLSAFEDGRYVLRCAPSHPTHNPNGIQKVGFCKGQTDASDPTKHKFFTWPDLVPNLEMRTPYLKTFLQIIEQNGLMNQFTAQLQSVVNDLKPRFSWRLPCICWCVPQSVEEPRKNGSGTYKAWKFSPGQPGQPGFVPFGITLDINQTTVMTRLQGIIKQIPQLNHERMGHNLIFTKQGNTYTLDPDIQPTPVSPEVQALWSGDDYPQLTQPLLKNAIKPADLMMWFQTQWWSPYFRQYGFNFYTNPPTWNPAAGQEHTLAAAGSVFPGVGPGQQGGYAPPQQGFTPPLQTGFAPPPQTFQPPPQQGYQAPAAQWTPPPAQAPPAYGYQTPPVDAGYQQGYAPPPQQGYAPPAPAPGGYNVPVGGYQPPPGYQPPQQGYIPPYGSPNF